MRFIKALGYFESGVEGALIVMGDIVVQRCRQFKDGHENGECAEDSGDQGEDPMPPLMPHGRGVRVGVDLAQRVIARLEPLGEQRPALQFF